MLVRLEPDTCHMTTLQVYLQSRGFNGDWSRSTINIHEWGMMQLENLMGCRIGKSYPKYVQW